jgi:hypothetical protein
MRMSLRVALRALVVVVASSKLLTTEAGGRSSASGRPRDRPWSNGSTGRPPRCDRPGWLPGRPMVAPRDRPRGPPWPAWASRPTAPVSSSGSSSAWCGSWWSIRASAQWLSRTTSHGVRVDRYVVTGEGDPRQPVARMSLPFWATECRHGDGNEQMRPVRRSVADRPEEQDATSECREPDCQRTTRPEAGDHPAAEGGTHVAAYRDRWQCERGLGWAVAQHTLDGERELEHHAVPSSRFFQRGVDHDQAYGGRRRPFCR